jgi:segregation and condensation protein A
VPDPDSDPEIPSPPDPSLGEGTLEFERQEPGDSAVAPPDYDYKVQLEIFEGPLDLLLYLIKREEVDVYDISIEKVTKQYMAFIETFRMLNIGLAGEFLVMAANLCYIKSRTLLPKHQQPPEEDAEDEDPRWDLIRQLIEYKKFKDAATFLQRREANQLDTFRHVPEKIDTGSEERPLADVSIFDLIRAFQNVIARFDDDDAFNEIVDERWTVSDKIDVLLKTVPPGGSVKFSSLFENASGKIEVIVTFLAVLELMKLNHFRVRQDGQLGEIELQRTQNT